MTDTKTVGGAELRVSRERHKEMALEALSGIIQGCQEDLTLMKRYHPPSKRGSNYQRVLTSLESRLAAAEKEVTEAMRSETEA